MDLRWIVLAWYPWSHLSCWWSESKHPCHAAVRGPAAQADKYAHLDTSYHFVPFVAETLGVLGEGVKDFTRVLARCIYKAAGEPCSWQFLLERLSTATQRGNVAVVLGHIHTSHYIYIIYAVLKVPCTWPFLLRVSLHIHTPLTPTWHCIFYFEVGVYTCSLVGMVTS